MKFVFFGTPEFASIVLGKLIAAGFIPSVVVCNPDRPVGRKKVITPPQVKARIMNYELGIKDKIKILQPEKLDKEFLNSLFTPHNSFDIFIVAAYAKILPKDIVEMPKLGTIGVHPSLLPKYRGTSPIQSAILAGEEETGVTLYLLDEKMDNGPIIAQRELEFPITDLQFPKVLEELAKLGGDLLAETLPKFISSEIIPRPQNPIEATFTKKFSTEDAFIEKEELESALGGDNPEIAGVIYRKILGLTPEPGVWTLKDGKRIKFLEAELQNGRLVLKVTQNEGQKPVKL